MERLKLDDRIEREFLAMPLRPGTMTFYTVRTTILAAVKRETARFSGTVLDLGCGYMPYRRMIEQLPAVERYVGVDLAGSELYAEAGPDLAWDGSRIPAEDGAFDCVMATEFLEHYSDPEGILREVARVMKPSGVFFATVPFIWNLHELPHDEYRYTPFSLGRHIANAGFRDVEIRPLGGWNMALAQMIGLWVGFAPMRGIVRKLLRLVAFPLYFLLVSTDRAPAGFDGREGSMYSGLSVTARR